MQKQMINKYKTNAKNEEKQSPQEECLVLRQKLWELHPVDGIEENDLKQMSICKKKHLSRNDIRIVQKGKDIYLKEIWPPPGWWSWWWPSWWRRAGWRTWWIWGQTRSGAACSALQCRSQTWNSAVWRMRTWRWHQIRKYFVNNWCIEKTTNLASWADLEKPLEANSRSIIIFGSGRDMAMLRKRT